MQTHTDDLAPRFLGIRRVAESLDVNADTVRRYIERGELPSVKIGGRRLIAEDDFRAFIDKARRETAGGESRA